MRRVASAAVLVLALSACSHGSGKPTASAKAATTVAHGAVIAGVRFRQFPATRAFGVSFAYPAVWHTTHYTFASSFSALVAYVSNVKLRAPYTTTVSASGILTRGRNPVVVLPPGGVLISWSNVGFPHQGPEIPHPTTKIDHQPATVVTGPADVNCASMGGDETITADIARPTGNHYEMVACLRGPNVPRNAALVQRTLATTRIAKAD
jgi:hypothetical protein